jgi:hypothetical protein
VVLLSVLAVWLFWEREAGRMRPARPAPASVALADDAPLQLRRTAAPARQTRPAHVPASSTAAPATPTQGAPAALGPDGPEPPHPITPQHEALREQQQLVGALNDALDQRDAVGLRALIERYDAVAPEDPQRLSEGYERVADCLDAPDPARRASARANGQRYYDDARASSLRRYVRRLCLEPGADTP